MDVEGLRKWAIAVLESTDVENATLSVDWLLSEVLHVSRARLLGYPEAEVDDEAAGRFRNLIARRAEGEPLQYILGYAEFLGLRFRVCPGVLIPRPETEVLVEEVLSLIEPIARPRVLDVGTGSGCIAA